MNRNRNFGFETEQECDEDIELMDFLSVPLEPTCFRQTNPRHSLTDDEDQNDFEIVEHSSIFRIIVDFLTHYFEVFRNTLNHNLPIGRLLLIAAAFIYDYKNKHPAIQDNQETQPLLNHDNEHSSRIQRALEEMRGNVIKEEEAQSAEIARRIAGNKAKLNYQMLEMAARNKEDEQIFLKKKLESEERLERLKAQSQLERLIKDQTAKHANEVLRKQGKRELEEIERNRAMSQKLHQENIENMDKNFQRNHENFEKEEAERKQELLDQKERSQQRRREIEDQLARDLEEMRRRDQQRKHEMDEQLRHIQRVLQMKVWNEVIESNWTRRLNTLRASCKEVEAQMKQFGVEKENKILLKAIETQNSIMEAEKQEMERLYQETGKSFLLDIKEAVEEVSEECSRLSYVLKNEPSNTERIRECFSALRQATMSIPTLAELKHRYKESMK